MKDAYWDLWEQREQEIKRQQIIAKNPRRMVTMDKVVRYEDTLPDLSEVRHG